MQNIRIIFSNYMIPVCFFSIWIKNESGAW